MKRLFFLMSIFTGAAAMGADYAEYHPLLEEGKVWWLNNVWSGDSDKDPFRTKVWIAGDTLIGDTQAVRLAMLDEGGEDASVRYVAVKEENRRVHFYDTYRNIWLPALDFSCHRGGSTIPVYADEFTDGGLNVEREGSVSIYGKAYRYLKLGYDYWIEGIGSPSQMLLTVFPVPTWESVPVPTLDECYLNDELLFSSKDWREIRMNLDEEHKYSDKVVSPDLTWQYYEEYKYYEEYGGYLDARTGRVCDVRLVNYSMVETENEKYPFAWTRTGYTQWRNLEDRNEDSWEFVGDKQMSETRARLREEDGKVYVSLGSLDLSGEQQPYYWFEGQRELSIYDIETREIIPYTPAKGEEVVLYDYTAEVGDRYRTLILGSVICDVTVVAVTESDMLREEDRIPGGGKVIEIVSDYADQNSVGYPYFVMRYAEGIGNIGYGDYLFLTTETPLHELESSNGRWMLNNVYNNKDGSILYKGYDFQGFSGIGNIRANCCQEERIYDLHGREVSATVPGSIYIRDGKKFVAK